MYNTQTPWKLLPQFLLQLLAELGWVGLGSSRNGCCVDIISTAGCFFPL